MKHGKHRLAEKHVNKAFTRLKLKTQINPTNILLHALAVLKPILGFTKLIRRRGKRRRKTSLVPIPITERRQVVLSLT